MLNGNSSRQHCYLVRVIVMPAMNATMNAIIKEFIIVWDHRSILTTNLNTATMQTSHLRSIYVCQLQTSDYPSVTMYFALCKACCNGSPMCHKQTHRSRHVAMVFHIAMNKCIVRDETDNLIQVGFLIERLVFSCDLAYSNMNITGASKRL